MRRLLLILLGTLLISIHTYGQRASLSGPSSVDFNDEVIYSHSGSTQTCYIRVTGGTVIGSTMINNVRVRWDKQSPWLVELIDMSSQTNPVDVIQVNVSGKILTYEYDASGNRNLRRVVTLGNLKSSEGEDAESIIEGYEFAEVSIYPNPTEGILNFSLPQLEGEDMIDVRVKVYSTSGSLVKDGRYTSERFDIDLSGQASGMYLLDLYVNGQKHIFTIIKK